MLKDLFRTIRACFLLTGILLGFFAFLELIRAFQTLYALHPLAGYVFIAVLLGGGLWLAAWFLNVMGKTPRAIVPPEIGNIEQADLKRLLTWSRYQIRFLSRLSENPWIDEPTRQKINLGLDGLTVAISQRKFASLLEVVLQTEQNTILPVLSSLDKQAGRQVRDCVRDVMIGVTLSPYKSADIFIVLYRNILMVGRIIKMYNTRPTFWHSVGIGIDILNIVATVNYINMGKNLIESLTSRLPGVGRLADDIAQGVGAGFMTSIAGHAAMDRCRAFRTWNPQQAQDGLLCRVGDFYADVRDIFFNDVWGFVKNRSVQATDQAKEAIVQAFDQTARTLTDCVRVPAHAAAAAGQAIFQTTTKVGKKATGLSSLWRQWFQS